MVPFLEQATLPSSLPVIEQKMETGRSHSASLPALSLPGSTVAPPPSMRYGGSLGRRQGMERTATFGGVGLGDRTAGLGRPFGFGLPPRR